MAHALAVLYLAFLIVVACFAVFWSHWPEKRGGWILATKQSLPPVLRRWHARNVIPIFILAMVLFLLSEFLESKS